MKSRTISPPSARTELIIVVACAWLALAAIPLSLGSIGISWDALNHHVYLGWTAFEPRFDRDWLAASHQAYQYPYLYWPFYKLVQLQVPGMWGGAMLVSLHVLAVPALWLIARACIPDHGWEGSAMRAGGVLLAFLGQLTLSLTDTTANDFYAATPLVWAVALGMLAATPQDSRTRWLTEARAVAISGASAGIAVAFKFSNGPLVLAMPLIWILVPGTPQARIAHVARGTLWSIASFALAYGAWGWQLWQQFGNPMYPFYEGWFGVVRELTGWRQP